LTWKEPVISVINGGTIGFSALQLIGPADWVRTATAGNGWLPFGNRELVGIQRSAQVAAGYVEENLQDFPGFHDLIDPTTGPRNKGIEWRDWIVTQQNVGACNFAWGVHDLLTVNDWTSLVGLGFEHGPDNIWKTFLKDCPGNVLPVRVIHQVALAALANVVHELAVTINGLTKQIRWMVDGVTVDTYTPVAPLDQIGGTAAVLMQKFRYRGLVPANGNMIIWRYGGGLSTPLLLIREFD
jgi:hypothetical protein